jgi:hypothetical protein
MEGLGECSLFIVFRFVSNKEHKYAVFKYFNAKS